MTLHFSLIIFSLAPHLMLKICVGLKTVNGGELILSNWLFNLVKVELFFYFCVSVTRETLSQSSHIWINFVLLFWIQNILRFNIGHTLLSYITFFLFFFSSSEMQTNRDKKSKRFRLSQTTNTITISFFFSLFFLKNKQQRKWAKNDVFFCVFICLDGKSDLVVVKEKCLRGHPHNHMFKGRT